MGSVFRVAREAGWAWNLAKSAAQAAALWALVYFALPALAIAGERALGWPAFSFPGQRVLGAVLFAAAGVVALWAVGEMAVRGRGTPLPFDTARELVVAGPYAHVRNPMSLTGVTQSAGIAIFLGSYAIAAYTAAGAVLWHAVVRPAEERDLQARFGDSYNEYRKSVRCWLPRTRK